MRISHLLAGTALVLALSNAAFAQTMANPGCNRAPTMAASGGSDAPKLAAAGGSEAPKLAAAGVRMTEVHEAIDRALRGWKTG